MGIRTAIELTNRATAPLQSITNALNITISNFERLAQTSGNSLDNIDFASAREEINQANAAMIQLQENINGASNRHNNYNNTIQKSHSSMNGLLSKVKQVVGAYASIQTVKVGLNLSDELTQTTARINNMNDGLQSTEQLIQMVYSSAQDARGNFNDMARLVARIGNNAKDAFGSNKEVIAFANIVQKQMNIAGASTSEASNAMLQLSQALGSGVLRGDELNSIFEQAPNLIQSIADYMNVPIGKIRSMAKDGELSADIVKNAVLASADEVNKKFDQMPRTWGQLWSSMKNTAIIKLQPLLNRLNEFANSTQFQEFANNAVDAFVMLGNVAMDAINVMAGIGSYLADNWSVFAPVLAGILGLMIAYNGALAINSGITAITAGVQSIHAASTMMAEGATFGATVAQHGFNAALLACPLTWIVIAIVAVIAAYFAVIAAINKVTGSHISAVGVIVGVLATAGAFIWNTVVGVINAIIQLIYTQATPITSIIEWILNVANGGFNSFGDAVKNLLGQIISWFLNLGQVVTKIIDAIFGTNWTSGLNKLENSVKAWGKNENAITLNSNAPELKRIEYGNAYSAGYNLGSKISDKVKNKINSYKNGAQVTVPDSASYELANKTAANTKKTADNTADMKEALDITSENIKYIRDFATQKAISRYTTTNINVEMNNNNSLNSNADIDGIVNKLKVRIEEEMLSCAEGVY